MSRYIEILAVQMPFSAGTDELNRSIRSCNFNCTIASATDKLEEEIGRRLFDLELGVFNTDMFVGPDVSLPKGQGPYTTIIDTGGTSPNETHNGDKYHRASFQIVVRAANRQAARTRALAIWNALDGQRDIVLVAA